MKRGKADYIVLSVLVCYLLLPIVATFIYSISTQWDDVMPEGFTLRHYAQLFSDGAFWSAIGKSLLVTILPVAITTVAMLLLMYVVTVHRPKWDKHAQTLCTIPYSIQGVILAVSVLSLFSNAPAPLSNRLVMLTGTYCVVIMPYMYQGIKNNLSAINAKQLIEAAQLLGASKFMAFVRVVVPNMVSGIVIATLLSSSLIFGDFVIMNIIGGNYFKTAQIYLFTSMKTSSHLSSAIVMVLFMVTLLVAALVFKLRNKPLKDNKDGLH